MIHLYCEFELLRDFYAQTYKYLTNLKIFCKWKKKTVTIHTKQKFNTDEIMKNKTEDHDYYSNKIERCSTSNFSFQPYPVCISRYYFLYPTVIKFSKSAHIHYINPYKNPNSSYFVTVIWLWQIEIHQMRSSSPTLCVDVWGVLCV